MFEQRSYGVVVECAACNGTGLQQFERNDGSLLCKGCNGAGKQALRFLPSVATLGEQLERPAPTPSPATASDSAGSQDGPLGSSHDCGCPLHMEVCVCDDDPARIPTETSEHD